MAGGKRKAEGELDREVKHGNGNKSASRSQEFVEGPDTDRKAECLSNVTALNAQFASWVARQKQERPLDLWRAGVQDYLKHAEKILTDFKDVVDWLSLSTGQNGSTDPPSASAPSKEPSGVSSASLSWSMSPFSNEKEVPAANGVQNSLFSWAPAVKSDDVKGSNGGNGGANAFSEGEQKGGSLPGWGAGFANSVNQGDDSEKQGSETANKKPSVAVEGRKAGFFQFPSAAAASAPLTTASLFPASAFQPPSKLSFTAEEAPASTASLPPEAAKEPPNTSAPFLVPAFPSTSAPSKPAEVKLAKADWAAAFSKPAAPPSAAPSFSLPGAESAAGPRALVTKPSRAEGKEEQEDKKEGAEEGDTPSEPPSPSFKAAEEEGVENLLETPMRMFRRSTGPGADWENQGAGSLTLKRDKGAPRRSKEANARVVFRNLGGKVLLNARLYIGMKVEVQNGAVHVILHATEDSTAAKGEDTGKPNELSTEVVTRLYAFRQSKKGGMAAEDLKAALEKEVPKEEVPNSDAS